jgi:hypothetical protein
MMANTCREYAQMIDTVMNLIRVRREAGEKVNVDEPLGTVCSLAQNLAHINEAHLPLLRSFFWSNRPESFASLLLVLVS